MKNEFLLFLIVVVVSLLVIAGLIACFVQLSRNAKRYKVAKKNEKRKAELVQEIAKEIAKLATNQAETIVDNEKYQMRKEIKDEVLDTIEATYCLDEECDDSECECEECQDVEDSGCECSLDDVEKVEEPVSDDACTCECCDDKVEEKTVCEVKVPVETKEVVNDDLKKATADLEKQLNELKQELKDKERDNKIVEEIRSLKDLMRMNQQVMPMQYVPYPQYQPVQYQPIQYQQPVPQCAPVVAPMQSQEVKESAPEEDDRPSGQREIEIGEPETIVVPDDSVFFSSKKDMTLEERYDELTKEQQGYFDELSKYAAEKENIKCIENSKYKEFKIGNNKVVKLEIKRDTVVASFIFIDAELRKYSRENKVAIKQKATPVKILSKEDVEFAKDSMNMVIKQIEDDIIAKKELQKEKRRKKKLETE